MEASTAVADAAAALELPTDDEGFSALEEGQLVVAPPTAVTYISARKELVLVLKARWPVWENGQKVGETKGLRALFRNHQLKLDTANPQHAELFDLMESHKLNDNPFNGFRRGVEPAPAATSAEMQNLVDAAIGLDADVIEEFIRQEEAGYKREDVLKTARMALSRVQLVIKAQSEAGARPPAS